MNITLDEMSGGGMSRLLKHMNRPFAAMSAFQEGKDRPENLRETVRLAQMLSSLKMGALKVDGHYEAGDYVSDEISFFIPMPKNMIFEQFEDLVTSMGKEFNQHSILLSDGEDISLVEMSGPVTRIGNAASSDPSALIPFWSKLKNTKFAIVDRDEKPSFDHTKLKD